MPSHNFISSHFHLLDKIIKKIHKLNACNLVDIRFTSYEIAKYSFR